VDEWEDGFKKQMQEYSRFQEFLHNHVTFLANAEKNLTHYPPQKWLPLEQQKALPPHSEMSRRKTLRANPLLINLRKQMEQVKKDCETALQRLSDRSKA
jgi:hypothetical protein